MSVEQRRENYLRLGGQLMAHKNQCPHITMPCHAWLSRLTDAASIDLDMLTAYMLAGPRPAWRRPSWMSA